MLKKALFLLTLPFLLFSKDEALTYLDLCVDLKNPVYKKGAVYTQEGGIIRGKDIRIQAKEIEYVQTKNQRYVKASGDLMVQYRGKAYIGDVFFFDFINKEGWVENGKTFAGTFYIGGSKIHLLEGGAYEIDNATLTTCESKDSTWQIQADQAYIKKDDLLDAKNVRFVFFITKISARSP